jgi:hypothetical protein
LVGVHEGWPQAREWRCNIGILSQLWVVNRPVFVMM